MGNWIEQFRSLGLALLEVFRAEWEALRDDFARSKHHLKRALLLLAIAAVVLFWFVGVLTFALGASLVQGLGFSVAVAAWTVVAVYLVVAVVCGVLGALRLKRVENPAASTRRRLDDHLAWWQETLLREEEPIEVTAASSGASRLGGPGEPRRSEPGTGPGRGTDEPS